MVLLLKDQELLVFILTDAKYFKNKVTNVLIKYDEFIQKSLFFFFQKKKKNRNDRISGMKKCTKRLKITLVKVVEKDMSIKEVAKTMTSLSH